MSCTPYVDHHSNLPACVWQALTHVTPVCCPTPALALTSFTASATPWPNSLPLPLPLLLALLSPLAPCVYLQRFFSATLQNFATQSLLMAVGVGARKALAASAAINWMLKDGMNRLVRMGVATQFGDSFDSDLKVSRAVSYGRLLHTGGCLDCG